MPNPSQGWYEDPYDPNAERWWDGSAWSEHVRPVVFSAPAVPAGWYEDPHVAGQSRYWNGAAWTEHIARDVRQYTDDTAPQRVPPPPSPSFGPAPSDAAPAAPSWLPPSHTPHTAPVPQSWVGADAPQAGEGSAPDVQPNPQQTWEQLRIGAFPDQSRPIPARPTEVWAQRPNHVPHPPKEQTFVSRLKGKEKKLTLAVILAISLIFGLQAGISEYREKRAEEAPSAQADGEQTSDEELEDIIAEAEDDMAARNGAKISSDSSERVSVAARDGNVYEFDAIYYLATTTACMDASDTVQEYAATINQDADASLDSREEIKKESASLAAQAAMYEAHADLLAAIGTLSTGSTINGIPLTLNYSKRAELQEYFKQRSEKIAKIAEDLSTASNEKGARAVIKKHGFKSGGAFADYLRATVAAWGDSFENDSVGIAFTAELIPACASLYD